MGNRQRQDESFRYQEWKQVGSTHKEVNLWQNRNNPHFHLQQISICANDTKQYIQIRDVYFKRKNHPRWVSALYLNQTENGYFCTSNYVADIFVEKIPIRLLDLTNVSFPNVLHVYSQALLGYYQFSREIGNFIVESQYMGVNQKGVLKTWAGATFSKISVSLGKTSQQEMVHSVIQCIQKTINKASMPKHNPSIRNFIYRTADQVNFAQAITQFQGYVRMINFAQIPDRLTSLNQNSGLRISFKDFLPSDRNHRTQNQQGIVKSQKSFKKYIPLDQSQGFSSQIYSNRLHSNSQQQITTFRKVESTAQQSNPKDIQNKSNQIIYQKPTKSRSYYYQSNRQENNTNLRNYKSDLFSSQYIDTKNIYLLQNRKKNVDHAFPLANIKQNQGSQFPNQQNIIRPLLISRLQINIQPQTQKPSKNISFYRSNTTSTQTPTSSSFHQIQLLKNRQHVNYISSEAQHNAIKNSQDKHETLNKKKNCKTNKSTLMNNNSNRKGPIVNFVNMPPHLLLQPQQNEQFTSYTVINEDQPTQMKGIPKNQLQHNLSALVNKRINCHNNVSHLESIEQINTERFSRNQDDSHQSSMPQNRNVSKIMYSHAPNNSYSSNFNQSLKNVEGNKNINILSIRPNICKHKTNHSYQTKTANKDSKSSQQFIVKMKSISFNSALPKQKVTEVDTKKKCVSFTDTKQNIIYDYYSNPTDHNKNLPYQQYSSTNGAFQLKNQQ